MPFPALRSVDPFGVRAHFAERARAVVQGHRIPDVGDSIWDTSEAANYPRLAPPVADCASVVS